MSLVDTRAPRLVVLRIDRCCAADYDHPMFIEIHVPEELPADRDDIEEAVSASLGDHGEVTGAGIGALGSNLDVEVTGLTAAEALDRIRRALRPFGLRSARHAFNSVRRGIRLWMNDAGWLRS